MKKITDEELNSLQTMTTEFNKLKTQLGDLALQKHGICLRVEGGMRRRESTITVPACTHRRSGGFCRGIRWGIGIR